MEYCCRWHCIVENGVYKSAMSLIKAADSDGNAGVGNILYRSAMAWIIAADSDGNAL